MVALVTLVLVVHWVRAFCVIREVCFGALDRRGLDGSDRNPWEAGSFHFIGSCKLLVPFNPSRTKTSDGHFHEPVIDNICTSDSHL